MLIPARRTPVGASSDTILFTIEPFQILLSLHHLSRDQRPSRGARRQEPISLSIVITGHHRSVKAHFVSDSQYLVRLDCSETFGPAAATNRQKREDVMNHSMYSADRATHLKIVVIGLLCATVVAVIGIFAHVDSNIDLGTVALVKAGQPTTLSGQVPTIR